MAELSTLARPYAKAVFEQASNNGRVEQWLELLALLSALAENSKVIELVNSPGLTAEQKADQIIAICGDSLDEATANFVRVLADNRRLNLLPEIFQQYHSLKAEREKTLDVDVIAAREIGNEQRLRLVSGLERRLQRTINLIVTVDPALLGGVIIRAGDTIIDGSIRGRLNKLSEVLNQ